MIQFTIKQSHPGYELIVIQEKGDFSSLVFHEYRDLLNFLGGYFKALEDRRKLNENPT